LHKGFILLNCDLGAEEYIVDELKQMPIIKKCVLNFWSIWRNCWNWNRKSRKIWKSDSNYQKTNKSRKYNDIKCNRYG